jgi:hypothetical protein
MIEDTYEADRAYFLEGDICVPAATKPGGTQQGEENARLTRDGQTTICAKPLATTIDALQDSEEEDYLSTIEEFDNIGDGI